MFLIILMFPSVNVASYLSAIRLTRSSSLPSFCYDFIFLRFVLTGLEGTIIVAQSFVDLTSSKKQR